MISPTGTVFQIVIHVPYSISDWIPLSSLQRMVFRVLCIVSVKSGFAKNINLSEQKTGNYLAICDAGAYGFVMASNYNTKSLPTEILIYNDRYAIIRNKEKISELIKKDIIPNWL